MEFIDALKIIEDHLYMKQFTRREVEVTMLMCQGFSNKEIGERSFTSDKAVKFILSNVYRKTGCRGQRQLMMWCFKLVLSGAPLIPTGAQFPKST